MRPLALILLTAALALAQALPPQPTPPKPVALRLDVATYGASSGASPSVNRAAIQRAHDDLARTLAGTTARGTLYVPGALKPYQVDGPIYSDASCIRWQGDGKGGAQSSVIAAAPGYGGPTVMVGLPRGTQPGASYRPDLFGKLDSSAASKAGQRAGLRTNGDLCAMSQGSPLTHGGYSRTYPGQPDYWQECDYLTVEAAVEGFPTLPACFIGAGNGTQEPVPFVLTHTGGGNYLLYVGYQTSKFGPIAVGTYSFHGPATGLVRLTCQLDLIARKANAWVNGVQVAMAGVVPAGVRLVEPGTAPGHNLTAFFVNSQYIPANLNSLDCATYGLSVSRTLKYADLGMGGVQTPNPQLQGGYLTAPAATGGTFTVTLGGKTSDPIPYNATAADLQAAITPLGPGLKAVRADDWGTYWWIGGIDSTIAPGSCDGSNLVVPSVADAYRYFPGQRQHARSECVDPYAIAYLPFTEAPGTRHLAVASNWGATPASGSMFLLNRDTFGPITSNVSFEGLQVDGGSAGVMMWHTLETSFDGCKVRGSLWGVANLLYGANYKVYLRNCQLAGYDAGYAGYWTTLQADTVTFATNGRWTMRLTASNVDAAHLNVATTFSPQYGLVRICGGEYGGMYVFRDFTFDNEGVGYRLAAFYAERHPYSGSWLRVDGGYVGQIGAVPLFMLRDMGLPPVWKPATLDAKFIANGGTGPTVAQDGPGWSGTAVNSGGAGATNTGAFPGVSALTVNGAVSTLLSPTAPAAQP